jgi:hypothetical protein
MSETELALLKASIDRVVTLETALHGPHLAQILFVFAEEDTPDVFYLEMEPGPDGELRQKDNRGRSVLLSDIVAVRTA